MIRDIERMVVKVGSRILTDDAGKLRAARIRQLADQIAACASQRRRIVLVSSGAIACGIGLLGLKRRPDSLAQLQACAAVGQSELMHTYARAFARRGLTVAQVLLTQEDLADRQRFYNAKQTLLTLMHRRVVPIVNENDTVAVHEITFGDNDRLAALVASAVDAQLLVLLSNVDGLMQNGAVIGRVDRIDTEHLAAVRPVADGLSKGGMASKLEAARIVGKQGIVTVIANGGRKGVLEDILSGKPVGTLFVPSVEKLGPRKWWIAYSLRKPQGSVTVDAGAQEALLQRGKSLLASGVTAVSGSFDAGDCVSVMAADGTELARGVSNYAAGDLKQIRGKKSGEIIALTGWKEVPEVVHRDQMVLAREWAPEEESA